MPSGVCRLPDLLAGAAADPPLPPPLGVLRLECMICGGAGSCIEAIHGAAEWAVERGFAEGAAELASGWLVPTSQL
ncbi:hypothetical protein [Pyrobaculum sp.]|uniref:hypothetical protein n=1 Tax=Pyrobaculum sp. TaxID=2004705 RepID=UPI003D099628